MTSSEIPADEFDNDEFDWEAAVREIDSACKAAAVTSISYQEPISGNGPSLVAGACPRSAKPNEKARQSTLDRFVDSYQKRVREREDQGRISLCGESPSIANEGGDRAPEVNIDLEAAKTWIYPVNVPLRDYQFAITKTALFSNTLVALPTGLGKTLIAAVVMYNYFRWFPEGKIVFTAPSRPLVMQQIEACHNIVGIPQEWTIDMTGQMNPHKRSVFWKCKRVFFVTPQVFEKDIQSGICLVKQLVCLVIDEAHRALGGFSYCVAVHELMAVPVHLRILALTATPGSKHRTIQDVINNLCISTLEYRNESHPDVSPHVHKRKIELIEVALGKDAIGISNMLSEAVRPLVNQLCTLDVLRNRDFATMSPCELLLSRDKFRQAPPLNLPHAKFGEVERWFASLITLCHIRKLLTSHGIRPAYEMLEEKLQGFARHLSKNEAIQRVKLLMQQSLSHGTPNPKLVKLMEILIDHFRTNDPKESRVIIFSNFRGSVKDIMNSLSSIGDLIKATEFIGQSSGKALKGQTQKMQQAVLQKFRTGGYNVIVATSIGEEGLDIMEVDLVICFDANISPLRMIQRMGRTGRKHDGRVVVLACEGSELKGYLKKQASSKAIGKHMHNGGIKSFDFHSSPRMVPHICKPEVEFVELSIERFIPRGRRLKDDAAQSPFIKKISDREKDLISKYFHPSQADSWRPSLIAFPHFQSFPSRVHKIRHSFKSTGMLIDAMQHLQGLSASKAKKVEASICLPEGGIFMHDKQEEALVSVDCTAKNGHEAFSQTKDADNGKACIDTSLGEGENHLPDDHVEKLFGHQFLFGENFVTVSASGSVTIASVPVLLHGGILVSNFMTAENDKKFLDGAVRDPGTFSMSDRNLELSIDLTYAAEVTVPTELRCFGNETTLVSHLPKYIGQEDHGTDVIQIPVPKQDPANLGVTSEDMNHNPENDIQLPSVARSRDPSMDIDLSPRLSHYLEEGVVPESPAGEIGQYSSKAEAAVCKRSIFKFDCNGLQPKCPPSRMNEKVLTDSPSFSVTSLDDAVLNESPKPVSSSPDVIHVAGSLSKRYPNASIKAVGKVQTAVEIKSEEKVSEHFTSKETHTTNSSNKEWPLYPEEVSKSLLQSPKYKRLRKYGDVCRNKPYVRATYGHTGEANMEQNDSEKGKEKPKKYVGSFIDEEAEVSEDAKVSQDEEESENDDEYEDSFIDDKESTREATEPVNSGDMLAFYRRSLLSQSPAVVMAAGFVPSHQPVTPGTTEGGSSPVKTSTFLQASEEGLKSDDPSTRRETSDKLESRKRKLSFQHVGASLATDQQSGDVGANGELSCDDDFYQSIDLDAVEEQATKLLRYKYELSITQTQAAIRNHMETKVNASGISSVLPTFDLGI